MAVGRPATARTRLLLAPGAGISQPRGWAALANQPALISSVPFSRTHTTVDEVHCVGGGSLLLWLLACAGKAPRGRTVYMHGPVVLPTPESCNAWCDSSLSSDDWRTQAIMCGLGGGGEPHSAWLRPLLTAIACGRADELGARFTSMQRRWERNGRLVHLPTPEAEDALLRELQLPQSDGTRVGEAPPTLLRCGETGCAAVAAAAVLPWAWTDKEQGGAPSSGGRRGEEGVAAASAKMGGQG